MQQAIIKLSLKQEISQSATSEFEQKIWRDSYAEFCLQAQAYFEGGSYVTFSQMTTANPKAKSLHYKVGFSVGLYLQQLQQQMPGTQDTLDSLSLPFELCEFSIIESDLQRPEAHRVALTYTSRPMLLLGVIGEKLLLTQDVQQWPVAGNSVSTFMVHLSPHMAVVSFEPFAAHAFAANGNGL